MQCLYLLDSTFICHTANVIKLFNVNWLYNCCLFTFEARNISNYSFVTASGSEESNFLQIPSIANLLTPDPYESPDIEVSSLVSQDQPGFKFPSSVDKFRSQDAKLLTSDPYYGGITGADKIDDAGDKIDVYYKEGNIYYSDYYNDEGGEDYYLDGGNTKEYPQPQDNLHSESVEDGFTKFESNQKTEVGKSSPQEPHTDNPTYSQGPLPTTDIVYSVPYSKTKIMNKQSDVVDKIFDTSVSDRSQNSSNFEDVFMAEETQKSGKQQNTSRQDQNSLVKIIEKKPNIMIKGHGEEKVMLVTPATISSSGEIAEVPFDVLTDKLTLDDIHNFTYEGW